MSPAARRKEEKPRGSASGILTTERLRILILGGIVAFVFLAMLVRLAYVQIQSADRSITAISNQSIRRIRIPARRGKIYTRDLKLLAGSSSDLNLVFYPQEMRVKGNRKQTIDHIYETAETVSRAIGKPNPLSKEDIARHLNYQPGLPLVVFRQLTPRELERAFQKSRDIAGIDVEPDESRTYPEGALAAHLIGIPGPLIPTIRSKPATGNNTPTMCRTGSASRASSARSTVSPARRRRRPITIRSRGRRKRRWGCAECPVIRSFRSIISA